MNIKPSSFGELSDRAEIKVSKNGDAYTDSSKPVSLLGRMFRALFRSNSEKDDYRAGINSYLNTLERTKPELATYARSKLSDRLSAGQPLTMRKVREIEISFASRHFQDIVEEMDSKKPLLDTDFKRLSSCGHLLDRAIDICSQNDIDSRADLYEKRAFLFEKIQHFQAKTALSNYIPLSKDVAASRKSDSQETKEIEKKTTILNAAIEKYKAATINGFKSLEEDFGRGGELIGELATALKECKSSEMLEKVLTKENCLRIQHFRFLANEICNSASIAAPLQSGKSCGGDELLELVTAAQLTRKLSQEEIATLVNNVRAFDDAIYSLQTSADTMSTDVGMMFTNLVGEQSTQAGFTRATLLSALTHTQELSEHDLRL